MGRRPNNQLPTAANLKKEGHMRQARYRFFLLPLFFVLACAGALAQANSEVTGIVTDQTGAVVAGARITLADPATGATKSTISDGTGLYNIPGLNPAPYNMSVAAKGFESFKQNGIVVNVSSTERVDVKLTVGAETQTVTVEADALAVQADSNVVSTLISSEEISELATANRNFAALAALGLGVSSALPDNNTPSTVSASFTISVNGLRQSHNIWLIDGTEADDRGGAGGMDVMPSQDAIAEFNMLTSNYPPDYGISSGATMSLSLKSGTQKFHGSGWEFNRNTDYDANDYFNKFNGAHSSRTVLDYNVYGFNFGGPLFIPKVYNQDKQHTFFFWNEEWRSIKQGSSPNTQNTLATADIPTAGTDLLYQAPLFETSKAGIVVPQLSLVTDPAFATKLTQYCPACVPGQPFPGGKIPAGLFDPNAVIYLNTGILPKPSTASGQSVESVATPLNARDDVVRVDHKWNDKWAILGHYMHDAVTQTSGQSFLGWDTSNYRTINSTESNPSNSAALKLTASLSQDLLVEVGMNYDGNIINIVNSKLSAIPAGWTAARFFSNGNTSVVGVSHFGAPYGTGEQMGSAPWHNAAEDYEPKVDVSYTKGKHAMKFGFSYNRYTKNQQLFGDADGQYSFAGNPSGYQYTGNLNLPECQGSEPASYCVAGDGIMDMLLGLAGSYDQQSAQPIRHYVNQTPSVYVMDNWHVTPRLTLQLGLRYDALPHAWERQNFMANFVPANYLSSASPFWNSDGSMMSTGPGFQTYTANNVTGPVYMNGVRVAGTNGFPRGLVVNDFKTYQPRIGFSEDLFGNGKTVLRGGFGTFFERMQGNDVYNAATFQPFSSDPSATQVYLSNPHISNQTGLTANTPFFPGGGQDIATHYPAPAVAQFSLGVQHELAPSLIWVVQYVGNLAWDQNIERNINTFPLTTDLAVRKLGGNVPAAGYVSAATGQTVVLPTSGQGNVASNAPSFNTYAGYSGINSQENTTNGTYNGFQTGLRVQNKWGLSGELDYTWSHEIDITSYDLNTVSNPWNLKYDKASGALDRRSILNANYMYKLPFFAKDKGLVHSIAGGWEIAGTFIDQTGVPTGNSFGNTGDTIGLGGGYTNRPNVSGKMSYPKGVKGWFDTTKFSYPTAAWAGGPNQGFGNAARDAIVGPGRVNFTTSLYKSFAITESAHIDLRFESFNTFNHAEFNGVNTSYQGSPTSGNFGWINSDWGPRILQLGGKVVF